MHFLSQPVVVDIYMALVRFEGSDLLRYQPDGLGVVTFDSDVVVA